MTEQNHPPEAVFNGLEVLMFEQNVKALVISISKIPGKIRLIKGKGKVKK